MKNYYQILEVNENASKEVIEKAYKVLARKYHPDTYPKDKIYWAENKFKEVTEAYEVLSNKNTRQEYDIRIGINSSTYTNNSYYKSEEQQSKQKKESLSTKISTTIANLIKDEANKPAEERSKDLIALVLTVIIIVILLFVFWKVPFLHNILFP